MTQDVDVLVVGAGPTGLVMASELARRGVSCRLIDTARGPTDLSKAIGIQARTLEVFQNMGIAEQCVTRGKKGRAVNVYDDGSRFIRLTFDELDSPFPFLLLLPQSETERVLQDHLERCGARVEREVKLVGFTQDEDGVKATLSHPDGREETVRAGWIVGCDGAHSTVPHTLGLPFVGEQYPEGFILADVRVDWELSGLEAHIFVKDGWLTALFPLPDEGRYRLVADVPPEQAPAGQAPSLEQCQSLVRERASPGATLSEPNWTADYRIHRRLVSRLREDRAFLVGDAAHIHSPAGAQGMNTGIQDAFNLAWKLALVAQGASPASLLDSYHAERYPVERDVLRSTDLLLKMVSLRTPMARAVRDKVAPILTGLGVVGQRMRNVISEVAVEYRNSPIVGENTHSIQFRSGPHPGDRAPDAPATWKGTGESTTLYEALRGTPQTLLLLSGPEPSPADLRHLLDIGNAVCRQYGHLITVVPILPNQEIGGEWEDSILLDYHGTLYRRYAATMPCLYLVRPDGYIGFRGQPPDLKPLRQYLDCFLLAPAR